MESHKIFQKFDLYAEVVQQNYMCHKEIIEVARALLSLEKLDAKFTHIDLGCGNAYFINAIYSENTAVHYIGVDLSPAALIDAENNVKHKIKWKSEFYCDDLLGFLKKQKTKVQFISCGFCLHHLPTDHKKEVFKIVQKRLRAGGSFFLYDVVRNEESKKTYNKRQLELYKTNWNTIPKDTMELIGKHILNEDFPENMSTYIKWGKEVGFSNVEVAYRDPNKLYAFIEFKN